MKSLPGRPSFERQILNYYWKQAIAGNMLGSDWVVAEIIKAYRIEGSVSKDLLLQLYRKSVPFFFVHALGIIPWVSLKNPGADQLGILEAYYGALHTPGMRRFAVRSGHKVSKSNSLVGLALHFFCCYPKARVPITSSSFLQVEKIIWYELRNIMQAGDRAGRPIGGNLYLDPQRGLEMVDGRQIFGFSTREPERAAGISGRIFYNIDEGSGVLEPVFEAIEGNRAGGALLGLYSNPTRTSGTFFEAFHGKRNFYRTVHISSRNTPNYEAGRIIVPGLATREWVDEKEEEWGENSPLFRVRVEGDFPPEGEFSVFPLDLIERSTSEWGLLDEINRLAYEAGRLDIRQVAEGGEKLAGRLRIGIDSAWGGNDETVIFPVRGLYAHEPVSAKTNKGEEVAARTFHVVERIRRNSNEPVEVVIDEIGGGLATLEAFTNETGRARCRDLGITVFGVNVQMVANRQYRYYNRRAEVAFELRDWMMRGGAIPSHGKLEADLAACNYELDPKGRYRLPDKKKEKEALGRSPDYRNSLELATCTMSAGPAEFKSVGPRATEAEPSLGGYIKGY